MYSVIARCTNAAAVAAIVTAQMSSPSSGLAISTNNDTKHGTLKNIAGR